MDIIILAILAESITQYVKEIIEGFNFNKAMALVVALVICFGTNLDIFDILEVDFAMPYVGIGFAAIILSRGANVVHDLLDRIQGVK